MGEKIVPADSALLQDRQSPLVDTHMMWLTSGAFALVMLLCAAQIILVAWFCALLRGARHNMTRQQPLPKAAVVLAVRGPDPSLLDTLGALLRQDYPDYACFVVVDSETDAAWKTVNMARDQANGERLFASSLRDHGRTRSLKCSALLQAVGDLDESYEVVAFIDADAPPHGTWLAELVSALDDPSVGVAYGNRWFAPEQGQWGSLVRYFWNAGAIVQVWLNGIVWAGSMAMPRRIFHETNLLEEWSHSLSVDGTVSRLMGSSGYHARFVPTLIMPNREEIELGRFMRWVERQLVAARSAGSGWAVIALHALNLIGSQIVLVVGLIWGLLQADHTISTLAVMGLLAYWVTAVGCVCWLELSVGRACESYHSFSWLTLRSRLRFLPALALTHIVYPLAMLRASFCNRVRWRGVEYIVRGTNRVEMVEYVPFQTADEARAESVL